MDTIKITLETLYDFLRNEKKREELQELEDTFYTDVVEYLREKNQLLTEQKDADELFAAGERDKIEYELKSIKRILKELYEKREKKIIDIALNKSRTGSDIIDTSSMLKEEKLFYKDVIQSLDSYRRGILLNLFKARMPEIKLVVPDPPKPKVEINEPTDKDMTKIKFIHPVPSFVWKDMNEYGPFDVGEETEIFQEVANLLVRKGRAERV